MADYKVVDAEKLDADLTGMADEVRILADTDSKMSLEAMTDNVAQANEKVDSQSEIIAQIKTVLQGKAASGGGGLEEIENLIDESGVLEDTEGSVTEKVEQLIDKAKIIDATRIYICFRDNKDIEEIKLNCEHYNQLNYMAAGCSSLKTVKLKNTQNVKTWAYCFQGTPELETIETIDFSSTTSIGGWDFGSSGLKVIKIVPETLKVSAVFGSQMLTSEGIQSIIDGLATVETAQTLTLNKAITLTDEQKATINSKGWTLAQ